MNELVDPIVGVPNVFGTYAPHVLLGAGVLLLLVPRWLRVSIAVAMIAFGLAGIWPELLEGETPVAE